MGILSARPSENPGFYIWNRVKTRYCDGASISDHPDAEPKGDMKLFFRGQLIIMDELLSAGLSSARQAFGPAFWILSAGGLATLHHCDDFRKVFPKGANVECFADAGFSWMSMKDIGGDRTMRSFYHNVVQLQGINKSLHKDCCDKGTIRCRFSSHLHSIMCFFPVEIIQNIRTPVFLVNPAYDFWQLQTVLVPARADPTRSWQRCRLNIQACSPSQLKILQGFRGSLLKALSEFQNSSEGGLFINSCYIHCQTLYNTTWHSPATPRSNNKTMAESVGEWYIERRTPEKEIYGEYPCNPSCISMDFT